jgi:hypothetical protein
VTGRQPFNYFPGFSDEERAKVDANLKGGSAPLRMWFSCPPEHMCESGRIQGKAATSEEHQRDNQSKKGHLEPRNA